MQNSSIGRSNQTNRWFVDLLFHMQLIHELFFAEPLYRHLKDQHIEFLQFAFRWMNNLLMRELPVRCTIRLWDTYLVGVAFLFLPS